MGPYTAADGKIYREFGDQWSRGFAGDPDSEIIEVDDVPADVFELQAASERQEQFIKANGFPPDSRLAQGLDNIEVRKVSEGEAPFASDESDERK